MGEKDRDLNLKMHYDQEGDVLYLTVGDPRKALSYETENDVIFRVDPTTKEIVGVTVIDFSKRFSERNEGQLSIPLLRHWQDMSARS